MSASTTLTKTSCKIKLQRNNPDLGPDLKCRIYLNDTLLDTINLKDTKTLQYDIEVRDDDNYLDIEHHDRDNANTETDAKNSIVRTSMVLIKDIKIHGVKFHATAKHSQNKFYPAYDKTYVEWAKQNEPTKNFPEHIEASPEIGINGKFRLHFKWPLYLHGLYYQEITETN